MGNRCSGRTNPRWGRTTSTETQKRRPEVRKAQPCAGFRGHSGLVASASLGGGKLVDTKGRNHPGSEGVSAQSCLTIYDPMDGSHQAPLSMGFSRQGYWSGLPFPSLGDLPDPGIKPRSPVLQASSFLSEPSRKPHNPGRLRDRLKSQVLAFLGEPGTFLPSLSS